jgi:hypothetical protein
MQSWKTVIHQVSTHQSAKAATFGGGDVTESQTHKGKQESVAAHDDLLCLEVSLMKRDEQEGTKISDIVQRTGR